MFVSKVAGIREFLLLQLILDFFRKTNNQSTILVFARLEKILVVLVIVILIF